jgi:hypothetical protein
MSLGVITHLSFSLVLTLTFPYVPTVSFLSKIFLPVSATILRSSPNITDVECTGGINFFLHRHERTKGKGKNRGIMVNK